MPFTLDPEIAAGLGKIFGGQPPPPPPPVGDVETRRTRIGALFATFLGQIPDIPVVKIQTFSTKASDGHEITLRWYSSISNSKTDAAPGPAVLYTHGGGMICLSLDHYDPVLKMYVAATEIPFLSVDYRLAPEVQAPIPVTDSYAGLQWLVAHAGELGVDVSRIALMGDSAGGGIAASLAHYAKQQGGPKLAAQVLIYPMLDDRNTAKDEQLAPFASWSADDNATGWGALLGDKVGSAGVPAIHAAARATVEECEGLPRTYVDVGELDIFRDEDLAYAMKLGQAAVSTEFHLYPGAPHAFEAFAAEAAMSKRAMENRMAFLKGI